MLDLSQFKHKPKKRRSRFYSRNGSKYSHSNISSDSSTSLINNTTTSEHEASTSPSSTILKSHSSSNETITPNSTVSKENVPDSGSSSVSPVLIPRLKKSNDRSRKSISALDNSAIHNICSGQVILNMASAVKELIENSLDAGATKIEIRLINYGTSRIQVVDNGCGIDPSNYHSLTKRHFTSKIESFKDLQTVDTFGFRGEALSSLCALGSLSVVTKTKSQSVGVLLVYNNLNELQSESPQAREIGTSVNISNLFSTLPVRLHSLRKNKKREFSKILRVLYAYGIISMGVKILCTHCVKLGGTSGKNMKSNISAIFGSPQYQQMVKFVSKSDTFEIKGFISKPTQLCGRGSSDRQFLYINGRPVDIPKLSRMINSIYKSFNSSKYPVYALNIDTDNFDINVTPDKRTVYMEQEANILDHVQDKLTEFFEPYRRSFEVNSPLIQATLPFSQPPAPIHSHNTVEDSFSSTFVTPSSSVSFSNHKIRDGNELSPYNSKYDANKPILNQWSPVHNSTGILSQSGRLQHGTITKLSSRNSSVILNRTLDRANDKAISAELYEDFTHFRTPDFDNHEECESVDISQTICGEDENDIESEVITDRDLHSQISSENQSLNIEINYDCDEILHLFKHQRGTFNANRPSTTNGPAITRFTTRLDSDDGEKCEAELSRELTKQDFNTMDVIGQFNMGFIIAKTPSNDLFIFDQHACDEKYNFEQLQEKTILNFQPLLCPVNLNLNAADELCVLDNLPIFRQNGFDFSFDESASPTERLSLIMIPSSKNTQFGESDVHEMLSKLREAPGKLCRPSRVRAMFASRACRKSVMVGHALDNKTMIQIVRHLSTMLQPWNCPHGRPTLRHLCDLRRVDIHAIKNSQNSQGSQER